MTSLFNSLAEISNGYSVFEKDQVLTEAQLNSVSEYLDDQDRLNRVNLIGVGIVCGLRVSLATSVVSLGKGLGITTDGDLLRIATDTRYTRFKRYDKQFPQYPPLYVDADTMLPAYELVEPGTTDPLAQNLGQFTSEAGLVLADMVALLLVESYIKDHDLCTGSDCDNHSKDYISHARLILVEKSSVSALLPPIQTADNAARALDHLASNHVAVSAAITSPTQLADRYRSACNSMHGRLTKAFPKLWTQASFLLNDRFPGNPTSAWITRLNAINTSFSGSEGRIQYYFDFLRDLIDTWNQMRDLLFGENAWCCPDINGFPKHLMLGNLSPKGDINENRLAFYAAAAINRDSSVKEAIFLAEKLDSMISGFSLPKVQNSASAILVTPSCSSKQGLQDRAIPYYFPHVPASPVHEKWNFRLSQRDMTRYNFSYHAASYSAQGEAADPLASAFDDKDFFRIEGHQGQQATAVLSALNGLIESNNLPFSVCALLLGSSVGSVVDRKGSGYSDLNRLHYLLRQDVVRKLDDVKTFSGSYTTRVFQAVSDYGIGGDLAWSTAGLTDTADNRNSSITSNSDNAMMLLNQDYQQYRSNSSWMGNVGIVMSEAGRYKKDFDKVSTTAYPTAFDSWVDYSIVDWLPWLDQIIEDKDDKADAKKLFREFIGDYPGLEHTGGVVRGGTFVVVYNAAGIVVADFMMSHYYKEIVDSPVAEPPLNKPNIPRGDIAAGGISFHPTWDKQFDDRLVDFKLAIDDEWLPKIDTQVAYQDLFQNFVGIYAGAATNPGRDVTAPGGGFTLPGKGYDDIVLGAATDRIIQETELIKVFGEKLNDSSLPVDERKFIEEERSRAQEDLARDMEVVAKRMDKSNTDVTVGADGRTSMQVINRGMEVLSDNPTALKDSRVAFETVSSGTGNAALATGIGSILSGNFRP